MATKKTHREDDDLVLDEDGLPVLDLSAAENPEEVSHETAIPMPKWGWWILLGLAAILVILSVLIPSQGLILGGSALALAIFVTHFGQETLLENYEKRIKERYGDMQRVELSPEQRRELREAIAEAEKQSRLQKRMERRAKREAKRSGRDYDEVLKEMKAAAKAEDRAKVATDEPAMDEPVEVPAEESPDTDVASAPELADDVAPVAAEEPLAEDVAAE